jgi:pteridine reductase
MPRVNHTVLKGKTAFVTGSGRRIGRHIALILADAGVNIVVHYRESETEAESLRGELSSRGVKAWLARADFESIEDTQRMFRTAADEAGAIDFMIHNASSFVPSTLEDIDFQGLMRDMQVNAWAPFMLSRMFALRFGRGKIVNLIDSRAIGHDRIHVGYILSKKVLLAMTELLAIELAPGVTVNAVAPGLILPPRGKDLEYLESLSTSLPLQRHGDVSDVSKAVLFLLESDFVTGQVIFVDGGRHLAEQNHGSHLHQ